jgi:hypothetical protein
VVLEDGSTAREQVLVWERPQRFEYRVDRFTSPLGRLVDHAVGSWEFEQDGAESSSFRWMYSFRTSGLAASIALRALVSTAWARYMAQCAEACVKLALGGKA